MSTCHQATHGFRAGGRRFDDSPVVSQAVPIAGIAGGLALTIGAGGMGTPLAALVEGSPRLYIHRIAQIDVAQGLAATDAKILGRQLDQPDQDTVRRDAEVGE